MSQLTLNAEKKNISLHSEIEKDTRIYSDKNLITNVLRNLSNNAIKYSKEGGEVKIYVKDLADHIEIAVEDNGIGISKEDQGKLFRIDVNHKEIGNSSEKGTGLGLILCKEFVEMMGGKIWVESELNRGSIFKFTVPKTYENS
jgi:signal transduction histidine kinase